MARVKVSIITVVFNNSSTIENSSLKVKAFERNYVAKKQIEIYRDIINE